MSTADTSPDTPGDAQADAREILRLAAATLRERQSTDPQRGRVERRAWRAAKSLAPRGALVFVQLGPTLITFGHDAQRIAKILRLPSMRHLRLRAQSCESLLDQLRTSKITIVIEPLLPQ